MEFVANYIRNFTFCGLIKLLYVCVCVYIFIFYGNQSYTMIDDFLKINMWAFFSVYLIIAIWSVRPTNANIQH
jgi:hypothetical protein